MHGESSGAYRPRFSRHSDQFSKSVLRQSSNQVHRALGVGVAGDLFTETGYPRPLQNKHTIATIRNQLPMDSSVALPMGPSPAMLLVPGRITTGQVEREPQGHGVDSITVGRQGLI